MIFRKRHPASDIGEVAAAAAAMADKRLEGRDAPQLQLMLDLAKTALGDAQARATALDAKSLAAIGFGVTLLVLTWPRFARAPALTGEYLAACFTGAFAAIAAVLSALGFTLVQLPEPSEDRYLPPTTVLPAYRFPTSEVGLLRRHLVSVHVLYTTLDAANTSRGNYLKGAQWCLIIASLAALIYTLIVASTATAP